MRELVGAKVGCVVGLGSVEHQNFSTAGAPGGRAGGEPIQAQAANDR